MKPIQFNAKKACEWMLSIFYIFIIIILFYIAVMDFSTPHPSINEIDSYCREHPNETLYPEYNEWWHIFGSSRHLSGNCTIINGLPITEP